MVSRDWSVARAVRGGIANPRHESSVFDSHTDLKKYKV